MPYTLRSREVPDFEAQPPRKRYRRDVKVNSSRIPNISIADIPEEVIIKILGYLPRNDLLLKAALVSTQWRRMTEAPQHWRRIDLSNIESVSTELVENLLKKSRRIIYINLYNSTFKEETVIPEISKQKYLETLILGRFYPLEFSSEKSEMDWKKASVLDDQALHLIAESCRNLIELDIGGCFNISPNGLQSIVQKCKQLKSLHLDGLNECLEDFIKVLSEQNSQIEFLSIQDCEITETGLNNLKKLSKLKYVAS